MVWPRPSKVPLKVLPALLPMGAKPAPPFQSEVGVASMSAPSTYLPANPVVLIFCSWSRVWMTP